MIAVGLSVVAGMGAFLLYSELALEQRWIINPAFRSFLKRKKTDFDEWLAQAGIQTSDRPQLVVLIVTLFLFGIAAAWMLFGGLIVPLTTGAFFASFPVASYKQRRAKRRSEAAEAWPRLIDEIRLLCGSLGRPIPQAVMEVGRLAPPELRDAFMRAEREWLISTDFSRTITVLKEHLADPTADATCETLLIAHTIGGGDVDKRLTALARDRQIDLQGRKDARAKQAGVRFARRFVLIVPVGMTLAGASIGDGRAAYSTNQGQMGVLIGLTMLILCWWWAGRLIRLPEEQRVFRG